MSVKCHHIGLLTVIFSKAFIPITPKATEFSHLFLKN